ncbi:hypothetical protein LOK49_LG05G01193 [Camellia lanceoleosa]|uniref:Uncharacterized protein n=1 Tax=Camellia lanceoleosa TaxID=1840588 RepID=A0ACC0HJR4_9ERIC|nr:hypothetical protein LOK49_LG05G01193 [Camellia lanceoleosa]
MNFLAIRRWEPDFQPEKESLSTTVVWARLHSLLIEYYDHQILRRIGNKLRKVPKIDFHTENGDKEVSQPVFDLYPGTSQPVATASDLPVLRLHTPLPCPITTSTSMHFESLSPSSTTTHTISSPFADSHSNLHHAPLILSSQNPLPQPYPTIQSPLRTNLPLPFEQCRGTEPARWFMETIIRFSRVDDQLVEMLHLYVGMVLSENNKHMDEPLSISTSTIPSAASSNIDSNLSVNPIHSRNRLSSTIDLDESSGHAQFGTVNKQLVGIGSTGGGDFSLYPILTVNRSVAPNLNSMGDYSSGSSQPGNIGRVIAPTTTRYCQLLHNARKSGFQTLDSAVSKPSHRRSKSFGPIIDFIRRGGAEK